MPRLSRQRVESAWNVARWPLALAAFVIFLGTSFAAGWTRSETDFPNYYTAAVLVSKGAPIANYYDWTWFQEQMNYVGVENQLGGYIPQTPLTMVPILPLARFGVQTAKRIWLVINVALLLATICLLSRATQLSVPAIALIAFTGFSTLHANFLLGQYYVFLLFVFVAGFCCLSRGRRFAGGMLLGLAFVLKLYGGPFLLYFVAKRQWKALAGMAVAAGIGIATATLLFGCGGVTYFALHILPRAVQGETLDPYNSGNGSLSTLLRRTFVPEAELNAAPVFNTPGLFFFLQPFLVLAILFLPLVLVRDSREEKQNFAFFCIAVLLASPNVASYTFILLLLPITLLINEAGAGERAILVFCYILLTFPMPAGWSWMFPKLWLLVAVFLVVLRRYRGVVNVRLSFAAIGLAAAIAAGTAARREIAYQQEPVRKCERAVTQRGAIYSSSPAVMRSGIVYEAIGRTHYVLKWAHEHRVDEFAFDGEALDPVAVSPNGPIRFRLIAHGASRNMLLDIRNGGTAAALGQGDRREEQTSTRTAALSPDGRWVAFTACRGRSEQIWIRRSDRGSPVRLTGGDCNNFSPAWELDSRGLIFASDCDRGIGLPGLYRMRLDHVGQR